MQVKEIITKVKNSQSKWYLIAIVLVAIFFIKMNNMSNQISELKIEVIKEQVNNNKQLMEAIQNVSKLRVDTVKTFTHEINNFIAKGDSTNEKIDNITSIDSLIAEYFKLRPSY